MEALVRGEAKPYEVATALMHELGRRASTVLVLEDVHWADEATLDVIRLLGRKVEGVPALVLVSYRDELDRVHPLRVLTGELSTSPVVRRLRVDPLSPDAVARLAAPHGVDAEVLYRRTGGNPFFVTEVLAAGGTGVPSSVRDAVLARAARIDPAARGARARRLGLTSMNERAASVGGSLTITSAPGQGTTVELRVPR